MTSGLVPALVGFGHALRDAGLPVGTGDVQTFAQAAAELNPADLLDLYYGGRTTLVNRRDDLPVYDRVFHEYFLSQPPEPMRSMPVTAASRSEAWSTVDVPNTEPPGEGPPDERPAQLGLVGSDVRIARTKAFADCTPDELAALRRLIRTIRLVPPQRRTRRSVKAKDGRRPDLRRTVRESLRRQGETGPLLRREPKRKLRRLVLILDVSGSMADYSRNLLHFAHSAKRACERVEVFAFGTRLTRITRELDHRSPDAALARAAEVVFDWEGGTRIGAALDRFVRDWGRRGLSRGAIVIICSDGLDRGDPAVLAGAMERLERLSHAIVWLNPHRGSDPSWEPTSLGMMVAAPHVDLLLSCADLAGLQELATALPTLG